MTVGLESKGVVHVCGVELTDDDLTKKLSKILPTHEERAILRIFIVIILISELLGPLV